MIYKEETLRLSFKNPNFTALLELCSPLTEGLIAWRLIA